MSGRNQVRLKGKIHLKLFKIILSSLQFKAYKRDCEPSNLPQPNYQNQSYSNVGMFLKWECLALI